MEPLRFRRTLSKNKMGYTYIEIPDVVAEALACRLVDLVVQSEGVLIQPVEN